MANGVVDIPLLGRTRVNDAPSGGAPQYGHFFTGPENRLIETALRAVVETPANGYNPMVIYGSSGTGKSHIVQGLAAAWRASRRRDRVVCTTAVDFARDLADAVESQGLEEFRARHRGADLWIVEDLGQLTSGKTERLGVQEELIFTLDALMAAGRWVVVTASGPPAMLPGLMPALRSRLTGGLIVPLAPPGPETRLAILRQLAALREIDLPDAVASILAEGIEGTAPELAGALAALAAPAAFEREGLDETAARKYVAQRRREGRPSLHAIALAAARHSIRFWEVSGLWKGRSGLGVGSIHVRRAADRWSSAAAWRCILPGDLPAKAWKASGRISAGEITPRSCTVAGRRSD